MGVDEGNPQVIGVDVILESCPITIVIINLLVHNSTRHYCFVAFSPHPCAELVCCTGTGYVAV